MGPQSSAATALSLFSRATGHCIQPPLDQHALELELQSAASAGDKRCRWVSGRQCSPRKNNNAYIKTKVAETQPCSQGSHGSHRY